MLLLLLPLPRWRPMLGGPPMLLQRTPILRGLLKLLKLLLLRGLLLLTMLRGPPLLLLLLRCRCEGRRC